MRHYHFMARQLVSWQIVAGLLLAMASLNLHANAQAAESARLMTYQQDGQTFYALSLVSDVVRPQPDSSSIVVLFDTSASQQGAYREAALSSLQALVSNLRPNDQVELLAVDLSVKALTTAPVAPGSQEMQAAVASLNEQIPLGSTDLAGALEAATERLQFSDNGQRTILYIGDGISVANLLDTPELTKVVNKLREARVSVSSFAVGPKLDAQLLAVLANQTGGNLYVQAPMVWQDENEGITDARAQAENARQAEVAGKHMADWAAATVLWPQQVRFASELGQTYPANVPPLRSDRDSIVLGVTSDPLPASISATIRAEGVNGAADITWTAEPEASVEDHAFLADIIKAAEADEGLSLPTIGTVGLMETARLVGARMDQLTRLAERAVAIGDHETAKRIADAVMQSDPGNVQARTVQLVVDQAGPVDQLQGPVVVETPAPSVAEPSGDISLVQGPVVTEVPVAAGGLLDEVVDGGELLDRVEMERRVFVEMLSKEIQNTLIDARAQITTNPAVAIQDLKLALESVQRVADLDAGKRAELVSKLRNALKEANYQASLKDELDRQREEQLAASRAQKLINERLTRRIEREKQLMDRFDALVDERRFLEAEEVAQIVEEIDPEGVTPRVATHWARFKRHEYLMAAARSARWQATWDAFYTIELAHIPFPDNPPIVYPDAEVWEELTKRRERWASVDLSAQSKAEERIQAALRSPLKRRLDYEPEQLNTIMDDLEEDYNIPIVFDKSALDDVAISPDSEVNVNLDNVSLRSALNIIFKEPELQDLTYVIDDEVLLITTEDKANETLKVKVYPVADLVLPVQTPPLIGGAGGGLGGGGGGGLGGGGGGGLGGGGGGFGGGGGGLGGGGGGGFFNVADDLEADEAGQPSDAAADQSSDVKVNWQARFAKETIDPAVVRRQVRQLMKSKQTSQAIDLIQAALQHGQAQPWMYESLGIAMELDGRPKREIERVIMSACDFSDSADELMLIANYLAHIGIDSRAVEVYQQVVKVSPLHHEAYALGLRAAQRAEDLDGIRWATVGVLSNDLPKQQQAVTDTARRVAKSVLDELKAAGDTTAHDEYYRQLEKALARDVIIRATWSGDADVDLIVEEPGGTVCSLHEPRTSGGGVSLGDDYSSYNKDSSKGHTEQYSCAKGFPGTYRVRVRKVWGDVVADKVTIEVCKNFGSKNQQYEKQRISIPDDSDAMVIFELDQSRREKPLEVEKLEVAVKRQDAISQAVLAQQLAGLSDPRIVPPVGRDRRGTNLRDRLALAGVRGAVGFQPIIQTLPEGTQLQVTGVVSPDRRYVRIQASPSFTGIGNVETFTFAGAPTGGGGGLGGGGGGGLGGGGGGGI